MTPLALLVRVQELPPPPEPTGSPEIDTVRVIGVVIVSLGVIVLLALAIRPFIVKPRRRRRVVEESDPVVEEPVAEPVPPPSGSIIPFPRALVAEGAAGGPSWTEPSTTIAERFSRVIGEPGEHRRKLGDRKPERASHDLATAALHRASSDASRSTQGNASTPATPLVALHRTEREIGSEPRRSEGPAQWMPTMLPQTLERIPVEREEEDGEPGHPTAQFPIVVGTDEPANEPSGERTDPPGHDLAVIETQDAASVEDDRVAGQERTAETAGDELDTVTLAALHQVVRDLIYCANSGEVLQGFALYSDPLLFRFLDESGMSEEEFRDYYGAIKARPRDQWEYLDRLFDIERLPDGAIEATASYVGANGLPTDGLERYRFVEVDGIWMIDEITPLATAAR